MRKCFWDLDEGSNIQLRIADNIPSNRRALTCNYSDAPVFTLHSATFCPKLQHNLLITEDLPLCCSSTCSSGRGRAMGEYESEREREREWYNNKTIKTFLSSYDMNAYRMCTMLHKGIFARLTIDADAHSKTPSHSSAFAWLKFSLAASRKCAIISFLCGLCALAHCCLSMYGHPASPPIYFIYIFIWK